VHRTWSFRALALQTVDPEIGNERQPGSNILAAGDGNIVLRSGLGTCFGCDNERTGHSNNDGTEIGV
jgi:hypothetical protein